MREDFHIVKIHEFFAYEREACKKKTNVIENLASPLTFVCDFLVGGFKHFLFSISYMGCHPSHWRTPSFFKMVKLPHQAVIIKHH